MSAKTNECAACKAPIYRGLLMCGAHWRLVPQPLQDRVYRTWGRFARSKAGGAERLTLLADYHQARDAAIAAVSSDATV